MKTIPIFFSLAIFSTFADAAAPAVGSISENQQFAIARKTASGFDASSFNSYQGKILILMMMTPWCPICQSHAQAVGNGLLDHFDNPSRGSLRGKNDNGVPIESLLLSTEEAADWDSVNESFSMTNGFSQWGLDADTQRQNPRQLLGYYRGGFINSNNLYDWGNDRRRVVVLNLLNGSASHSFREIVLNQNSYSSSNDAAALAAINRILPQEEITLPVIGLEQGRTTLQNGTSTVSFGKVVPRGSTTLSFTIRNTGEGDLTGITTSLTGQHAADYRVSSPPNNTLAQDRTTIFSITFKPSADGPRRAVLNLASTVAGVAPVTVNLVGTQPAPEIEIHQPVNSKLTDGRARRSFGTAKLRGTARSLTFTIINTGDATLTNLSLEKAGKNPFDFIVSAPGKAQLAPGTATTFKVTFAPRATGIRDATLKLLSNDADENPFDMTIVGLGVR